MNWLQRFRIKKTEDVDPARAVVSPAVHAAISVDLVYDQILRTVDAQHENAQAIDSKASFILTSATLVMGLNGLIEIGQGGVIPNVAWMLPASILFLFVLVAVFQSYRSRSFMSAGFSPEELQTYLFDDREYTQRQFIATMRLAHEKNDSTIKSKGKWLKISEYLFIAQVFTVVVTTLVAGNWDRISRCLGCAS